MKVTVSKKGRSQPLTVKIKGDWEKAMAMAVNRPKPKEGWPAPSEAEGQPVTKKKKPAKS